MPDDARAALSALTALEPTATDTWSITPPAYEQTRLFGGHALIFALAAGGRTVDAAQPIHSLHAQFLRVTPAGEEVEIAVERIRDGRNVTLRRALLSYRGKVSVIADLAYHRPESGAVEWQTEPAEPLLVEGLESAEGALRDNILFSPFEIVPIHPRMPGRSKVHPYWARPRGELGDDPLLHACALAWLSDFAISVSAHHPGATKREQHGSVTLEHNIWFHQVPSFPSWRRVDVQPQVNSGGRGLAFGHFTAPDGTTSARFAQDVLLRPPGA
jgi:acyl-CoA thioesterase II